GYGATVETLGDDVTAFFGVPVVHEDDSLRAVRAAVELRDVLEGVGVRARIALATGEVLVEGGETGPLVTGKVVALAAELAPEAELGELVLSTETAASVRETVAVAERAGAGESTGVRLVEVVPDAEPRVLRLDARLVGRDRELAALASAFASTSGQA